ncbi:hypothetical protein Krac_8037 [Ktedonobacter racemifer DSM 44963]|uniref:Uncharacterized protein n=1 Tax=Ktedonobacter racemifer DSM 44963 TaxID=485913 RepID=D6TLS6_KTERA|nr:hypothetical protein Krac_8037 [Ktedonobacter racemifer DSM 44963]
MVAGPWPGNHHNFNYFYPTSIRLMNMVLFFISRDIIFSAGKREMHQIHQTARGDLPQRALTHTHLVLARQQTTPAPAP